MKRDIYLDHTLVPEPANDRPQWKLNPYGLVIPLACIGGLYFWYELFKWLL